MSQINKRSWFRTENGRQTISNFKTQIQNAVRESILSHHTTNRSTESHNNDKIVNTILLYSQHHQIIAKWYERCHKLGPFSNSIKDGYSINDIQDIESKIAEKCFPNSAQPFSLPTGLRISLMISDIMFIPWDDESRSNISYPENILNRLQWWEFGANSLNDVYRNKLEINDNEQHFVKIGEINSQFGYEPEYRAVWNVSNNKLFIVDDHEQPESPEYDSSDPAYRLHLLFQNNAQNEQYELYDIDDWMLNQCFDHRKYFEFLKSWCYSYFFEDVGRYCSTKKGLKHTLYDECIVGSNIYLKGDDQKEWDSTYKCIRDWCLTEMYKEKIVPLVHGLFKMYSEIWQCNIPIYLADIILSYFPLFINLNTNS